MASGAVYVSSIGTTQWQADPELPPPALMHVLCAADGVEAGLTRIDESDGPIGWTPPVREVLLVLEGRARIEVQDGEVLDLGPGDMASLPGGVPTTWTLTTPFRELWVFSAADR
jgi:uncharacterized cupin superfamily protein